MSTTDQSMPTEWNPHGTGEYKVQITRLADGPYPYFGSDILLQWIPSEPGQPQSAAYTFKELPSNPEPRGLCVLARRSLDESPLPKEFVIRLPDIGNLTTRRDVESYIRGFGPELNAELATLKRLDNVRDIAHRLPGEGTIPTLRVPLDEATHEMPVLLSEFVAGNSLKEWCDGIGQRHGFSGCQLDIWFFFAKEMIRLVQSIHLAGAPHGYICPENIIVDVDAKGKPTHPRLVNLEREIPDPTLHLDKDPDRKDYWNLCWRRRYDSHEKVCYYRDSPDAPEFYDPFVPGDIFSLGLTLLYLATGELVDPFEHEEQWKDKKTGLDLPWHLVIHQVLKSNVRIKDEIYALLKSRFLKGSAKNDPEVHENVLAATEIIFACLRVTGHRFHNARSILKVYDRFHSDAPSTPVQTQQPASVSVREGVDILARAFQTLPEISGTLVETLYTDRSRRFTLPLREEKPMYRYTVGPGREEIVDTVITMLLNLDGADGQLNEPDTPAVCQALTTPGFFFDENCGAAGRVLSALKIAAVRGAIVEWLFLLNEHRMNVPEVVRVMNHQKKAVLDIPDVARENLKSRWFSMAPVEYKKFLRQQPTSIYLRPKGSAKAVLVVPDYASERGEFISLRVFPASDQRVPELREAFQRYWKPSNELSKYPHSE
ncbi:MAG: serine/threonine protein kinase [Acidobacteria bacterium]|nr:serine/threonine protein kinase [Acidobacteriota bacterium]